MSSTVSGNQYGIGLIAVLVASAVSIGYYQMYWLPEQLAVPEIKSDVAELDKDLSLGTSDLNKP